MTKFYRDLFRKKAIDEVHPEDVGDGEVHGREDTGLKRTLTVTDLTAFGVAGCHWRRNLLNDWNRGL